jgi:phosphoribosylformylglycinamidine synthase
MAAYEIYLTLQEGIFDPAGATAKKGLEKAGFTGVHDVRIGKYIELTADADLADVEAMCEKLLANTVIEDYRIEEAGECCS